MQKRKHAGAMFEKVIWHLHASARKLSSHHALPTCQDKLQKLVLANIDTAGTRNRSPCNTVHRSLVAHGIGAHCTHFWSLGPGVRRARYIKMHCARTNCESVNMRAEFKKKTLWGSGSNSPRSPFPGPPTAEIAAPPTQVQMTIEAPRT